MLCNENNWFYFFLLQRQQRVKWCITLGGIGNKICHALNLISHHVNGINQMNFEFREYIILFKFTSFYSSLLEISENYKELHDFISSCWNRVGIPVLHMIMKNSLM